MRLIRFVKGAKKSILFLLKAFIFVTFEEKIVIELQNQDYEPSDLDKTVFDVTKNVLADKRNHYLKERSLNGIFILL